MPAASVISLLAFKTYSLSVTCDSVIRVTTLPVALIVALKTLSSWLMSARSVIVNSLPLEDIERAEISSLKTTSTVVGLVGTAATTSGGSISAIKPSASRTEIGIWPRAVLPIASAAITSTMYG